MLRGFIIIPIFILIAFSILFFSHYFIYFSFVHFFGIAALGLRASLAAVLFLLPVTFIASSILTRHSDNIIRRAIYFLSGLWLGVGLTLALTFALAWGVWGVTELFTGSPSRAIFGWVAVALACLYSGYGVWNAAILACEASPCVSKICLLPGRAGRSCSSQTCTWAAFCAPASPRVWWPWPMGKSQTSWLSRATSLMAATENLRNWFGRLKRSRRRSAFIL